MPKKKQVSVNRIYKPLVAFLIIFGLISVFWYKNWQKQSLMLQDRILNLLALRLEKDTTLVAVVGDLHYYGFIKDEGAFEYALEHTKD